MSTYLPTYLPTFSPTDLTTYLFHVYYVRAPTHSSIHLSIHPPTLIIIRQTCTSASVAWLVGHQTLKTPCLPVAGVPGNVALYKEASQSSVLGGGSASLAVDGDSLSPFFLFV